MKLLVYSAKDFELPFLTKANTKGHHVVFSPERLTTNTAIKALGFEAVSIFSADDASGNVLEKLHDFGVKYIVSRSTGYDNLQLVTARELGIRVAHSPAFSPNAVAEHAIALYLAINRHIIDLVNRVKRFDFTIDPYVGVDLSGKKAGILGTGAIGSVLVRILNGFGCQIFANDLKPNTDLEKRYGVVYLEKDKLIAGCDVIFICLPLNEETHKLFDRSMLALMKPTAVLVNVARGGIVDSQAVLDALDEQLLAGYATDVFEKEGGVFYGDHSEGPLQLPLLEKLIDHPNVLLTPHQAFITNEGLSEIARMLFETLEQWERGRKPPTEL